MKVFLFSPKNFSEPSKKIKKINLNHSLKVSQKILQGSISS